MQFFVADRFLVGVLLFCFFRVYRRFRCVALRLRRLLCRVFVLSGFALLIERFIKVRVKRAHRVFHGLRIQFFARDVRNGRNGRGGGSCKHFSARHQRVKRALRIRLHHAAFVIVNGIVALLKRIVKRLYKLRLRFAFTLLRLVCPGRLGVRFRSALPLVRAATVFHREFRCVADSRLALRHGNLRLELRGCFRYGFARFFRHRIRFFRHLRQLRLLRGRALEPVFRQRAVLNAIDVLHQQRGVFARVRQRGVAEFADRFIKRVSVQSRFGAVDLTIFYKLGKSRRRNFQLVGVLFEHGVKRIHHLFIFAFDDLRVA